VLQQSVRGKANLWVSVNLFNTVQKSSNLWVSVNLFNTVQKSSNLWVSVNLFNTVQKSSLCPAWLAVRVFSVDCGLRTWHYEGTAPRHFYQDVQLLHFLLKLLGCRACSLPGPRPVPMVSASCSCGC
jgi:hypothetical protein